MKNKFKLFGKLAGLLVLILAIAFFMAACDDPEDDDPTKLRLSNLTVLDNDSSGLNAFVKLAYIADGINVEPIGNHITGTPKVQISNEKLTIELDQPKPASLNILDISGYADPSNAKAFIIWCFTHDGDPYYDLIWKKNGSTNNFLSLVYVDKDVTFNGEIDFIVFNNTSLKLGWNFVVISYDSGSGEWIASNPTQTIPTGYTWSIQED